MSKSYKDIAHELLGDDSAERFIDLLFGLFHFWDDLIDRDKALSDDEINKAMWSAAVYLPANPFYRQFFSQLQPLVVSAITNWQIANRLERESVDSEERDIKRKQIAFVLRSDYANILMQSIFLLHGAERAVEVGPYIREHWTHEDFSLYCKNLQAEAEARSGNASRH
jgi:hypothetical protein